MMTRLKELELASKETLPVPRYTDVEHPVQSYSQAVGHPPKMPGQVQVWGEPVSCFSPASVNRLLNIFNSRDTDVERTNLAEQRIPANQVLYPSASPPRRLGLERTGRWRNKSIILADKVW